MKRHIRIFFIILILLVIDQATKMWALTQLQGSAGVSLISEVFEFQYLENRGAAFGILQNHRELFLIMTVAAGALLTYFYVKMPDSGKYTPLRCCYVGLMAGAVGNLIDRMFRGYVIDFLYFRLIDFPIFNVADIYVTVTVVILLLLLLFYYKEEDLAVFGRKETHGRDNRA